MSPELLQQALVLARLLQERGAALQTREEKRQQAEFERLVQNPKDKATLMMMTDQAFRSRTPARAADQLTHILDVQGVPRFFTSWERTLLKGFQSFGDYLPGVSMPLVKGKLRSETANVILPAETELLAEYLTQRRSSGLRMNVNYLGEALLGEEDAKARLRAYLAALERPEIEVISVKVSTLFSQITPLGTDHAVKVLSRRMEHLYRAAQKHRFIRADGVEVSKFVYLDMEEYRDLELTLRVFLRTLERPGLEQANAGIALQAYVADSFPALKRIHEWARRRVENGGSPVTVRLVKGANMEAERVEAAIAGWPQAPFTVKADTDANFKRMLHEAMRPENLRAVRIGVASHNLFDVAYAVVIAREANCLDQIQFEMLEGMANHQRRALREQIDNVLLYAPATKKGEFTNAIGYLVRRLDENTGPDNFLRHAFKVEVDDEDWTHLEQGFLDAFKRIPKLPDVSRRAALGAIQDRQPLRGIPNSQSFLNEPDTDFVLEPNRSWAKSILESCAERIAAGPTEVPLVVAGKEILEDRSFGESVDPSRPDTVVARFRHGTATDVSNAIACAKSDPDGFRTMDPHDRAQLLGRVADELVAARAELLGAALVDGGKLFAEADPEVSEAIDFVRYYAVTALDFQRLETVDSHPVGAVVVVSPWNFPIAIPCGGISAALAAGNTVILKPSSDTVLVAYTLCMCFWRAGISKSTLQFIPCADTKEPAQLVASSDVDAVVLTGGTRTALAMLESKPDMPLLAETGGKNATIITAMSDRDQAVKHVVQSAFGHGGQKCSATSLLILEGEVYDNPVFKETLCDAVRSLPVGSAWNLHNRVGPLIRPPQGDLDKGLKELDRGETWAVLPRVLEDNRRIQGPCVKWGVARGSYAHRTEFFGPVLSVMRAENLEEAIEIANETGYGLTAGLESLDRREQELWKAHIRAGNLYINRSTTGAIVQRQPFGGMGKSAFGPGIKAGGPNYVSQFMSFVDVAGVQPATSSVSESDSDPGLVILRGELEKPHDLAPEDATRIRGAINSYERNMAAHFSVVHDPQRITGQDNFFRYLPVPWLRVRVHRDDSAFEIIARVCAAKAAGCRITVSSPPNLDHPAVTTLDAMTERWAAAVEFVEESDNELADMIATQQTQRVRYAGKNRVPERIRRSVGESGVYLADAPVLAEGRIELLWYLNEQSLSINYHRYGNLGERGQEERRLPP